MVVAVSPMTLRRVNSNAAEPVEAETSPQAAPDSHLDGKWRDRARPQAGTEALIAAFIDRVFVSDHKIPLKALGRRCVGPVVA